MAIGPKAQSVKDDWIKETQSFQQMMREPSEVDSYEKLSAEYDRTTAVGSKKPIHRQPRYIHN